jgi:hypothetical protein
MWFPSLLYSRSTRELLALASVGGPRSPKTSLAIAALALAATLWNPSSAQAGFQAGISGFVFDGGVNTPLFNLTAKDPANPVALSDLASKSGVEADASASCGVGPLGVSVHVENSTGPFGNPFVKADASVEFDDTFSTLLPGKFIPGQLQPTGTLKISFLLGGTLNAAGEDLSETSAATASVQANYNVEDQVPSLFFLTQGSPQILFSKQIGSFDGGASVSQDFTMSVGVLLGVENQVHFFGGLAVSALADPATTNSVAEANFKDPFVITSVQLFNAQGQFIENVSLTDSFGNALQVGPLASALPEPASLTLLGIGSLGLLGYSWRKGKRCLE